MTLRQEIVRKSIHLLTLFIPIAYFLLPRKTVLGLLGIIIALSLIIELFRLTYEPFSIRFHEITDSLLREHERYRLTGATYLFISSFLCVLLFEKWIAIVSILFLIVSDGLGGLAGKVWGRHTLFNKKTFEGSLIFVLISIPVVIIFSGGHIFVGFLGLAAALIVDIFFTKIDDNLTIPLAAGGVMQICSWFLMS